MRSLPQPGARLQHLARLRHRRADLRPASVHRHRYLIGRQVAARPQPPRSPPKTSRANLHAGSYRSSRSSPRTTAKPLNSYPEQAVFRRAGVPEPTDPSDLTVSLVGSFWIFTIPHTDGTKIKWPRLYLERTNCGRFRLICQSTYPRRFFTAASFINAVMALPSSGWVSTIV